MIKSHYYISFLIILSLTACKSDPSVLHGYVEADYQYVAPTTSGILKDIYVQRGDQILQNTALFSLEDIELNVNIETAKADIQEATAVFNDVSKEYDRMKKLLKVKDISQSAFDKQESDYLSAKSKLDAAHQNLINAEKKLQDSAPFSKNDAYVEMTFFVPGEFVQAGQPVISLLSKDNIKVRFFVPQDQLPKIKKGDQVTVKCDGSEKIVKARITYISQQAEYTPPVIYSTDARQKMVFMVEAKPEETSDTFLYPGLPVDIQIESIHP